MPNLSITMKRNALRVAEVWMDDYKHNVNLAWNLPFKVKFNLKGHANLDNTMSSVLCIDFFFIDLVKKKCG
jgi:hypothetical protein